LVITYKMRKSRGCGHCYYRQNMIIILILYFYFIYYIILYYYINIIALRSAGYGMIVSYDLMFTIFFVGNVLLSKRSMWHTEHNFVYSEPFRIACVVQIINYWLLKNWAISYCVIIKRKSVYSKNHRKEPFLFLGRGHILSYPLGKNTILAPFKTAKLYW